MADQQNTAPDTGRPDSDDARRVIVPVGALDLWLDNPRIAGATSQDSAMRELYSSTSKTEETSHRQMLALATSIAKNGYQYEAEPILVIAEKKNKEGETGRYVVQDANRRLAAIRLLTDPDKYSDMLTSKNYENLKKLRQQYPSNIPDSLEVVVYPDNTDQEKEIIRGILERRHDGSLGGAGTVAWGAKNKKRFEQQAPRRHKLFYELLEEPFREFYGKSLTDYLGGSITTTRRLFNSRPVEQYLGYTPSRTEGYDMERVKMVADAFLAYKDSHYGIPMSRFGGEQIKEVLSSIHEDETKPHKSISDQPVSQIKDVLSSIHEDETKPHRVINNQPDSENRPQKTMSSSSVQGHPSRNRQNKLAKYYENNPSSPDDNLLGSQWYDADMLLTYKQFDLLNEMLISLNKFGKISGKDADLRASILAPSIRVFFELAVCGVEDSHLGNLWASSDGQKDPSGKQKTLSIEQKVAKITEIWGTKSGGKFLQAITNQGHPRQVDFLNLNTFVRATDFAKMMKMSNLTSHRSSKFVPLTDIKRMFNAAVLFVELCEQYVAYSEGNNAGGTGKVKK